MERYTLGWASLVVVAACLLAASGGIAASAPVAGSQANDTLRLEATGDDVTVGQNVTIEFDLSATQVVNGSAIVVDMPEGFEVVDSEDAGGVFNGNETTWFWLTQDAGETVSPSLTVSVPEEPGEYVVQANASDAAGQAAASEATVTVDSADDPEPEPNATLSLSAEGGEVSPGANATVDFSLTASEEVAGPAVVVDLPEGFEVVDTDNDGSAFNENETTWFWLTQNAGETVSPSLTVAVPEDPGAYVIHANASDADRNAATASGEVVVAAEEAGGGGGGYVLPPDDDPAGNGPEPPTNGTSGSDSGAPESAGVEVTTTDDETQINVENARAGESITVEPGTSGAAADLTSLELDVADGGSFELTTSTAEPNRVDEDVDPLPGDRSAVEYFALDHELSAAELDGATIQFRVNKDSLANDIDADQVRLERYADGDWQALETSVVEEGTEHVVYDATTPGFSVFAVSAPAAPGRITVTTAAAEADEVSAGTTVDITATIENVGATAVDRTVTVTADNETLTTKRVSLEPGENRNVTITWTASEAGSHEIRVGDKLAGVLQVTAGESSSDSDQSEELPGFTLGLALVAIVVAAGGRLYRVRRD